MNKDEVKVMIIFVLNLIIGFILFCSNQELVKNIYNFGAVLITTTFASLTSGYFLLLPKQVIQNNNLKKEFDGEILSFACISIITALFSLVLAYQSQVLVETIIFFLILGIIFFVEFITLASFYELRLKYLNYKKKRKYVKTTINELQQIIMSSPTTEK